LILSPVDQILKLNLLANEEIEEEKNDNYFLEDKHKHRNNQKYYNNRNGINVIEERKN